MIESVTIIVDGTPVEYHGRTIAEIMGRVRLGDLRRLVDQARPNRVLIPGMDVAMRAESCDGYGWIAIRAYELATFLNAVAVLDAQIEGTE